MDAAGGSSAAVRLPRRPGIEAGLILLALGLLALALVLPAQRALLFSYVFLPVGIEAVIFGWKRGLLLALGCVGIVLVPLELANLGKSLMQRTTGLDTYTTIALWGLSLVLCSVVVGRVSEHGGARALAMPGREDPILAVEKERARVSHDIHDGVTQSVAAALMEIEILESLTLDSRPEVLDEVRRLKGIIGSALSESRTMIGTLRPPPLDATEFEATLTRLFEDFEERSRLELRCCIDANFTEHSYAMRICVYRVLQEALNNVEQHAQATKVSVRVKELNRAVFLSVVDDGRGFVHQPRSEDDGLHFGLTGMEERVEHLGGFLEIRSELDLGTAVRAYIPGRNAGRARNGKR